MIELTKVTVVCTNCGTMQIHNLPNSSVSGVYVPCSICEKLIYISKEKINGH